MPEILNNPLILTVIALITGVAMTFLVRAAASKLGFVAKPKADRWHKRPTAMLGGAAIFLTTAHHLFRFCPAHPRRSGRGSARVRFSFSSD